MELVENPALAEFKDEELLYELLYRHPPKQGPFVIRFAGPCLETVVGVGKDHVITLHFNRSDLKALKEMIV